MSGRKGRVGDRGEGGGNDGDAVWGAGRGECGCIGCCESGGRLVVGSWGLSRGGGEGRNKREGGVRCGGGRKYRGRGRVRVEVEVEVEECVDFNVKDEVELEVEVEVDMEVELEADVDVEVVVEVYCYRARENCAQIEI